MGMFFYVLISVFCWISLSLIFLLVLCLGSCNSSVWKDVLG